jgi:hypothetical protein
MKGMEFRALVCVRCLLGVEKVGRDWVTQKREVKEAKEKEEVKEIEEAGERAVAWREEEICGFGEDNMKECITKLARE